QHGVSKEQTHLTLGCDEVRGPCGVEDVLIRGQLAFLAIGIEQCGRGAALHDQAQFPTQIVDILDAAVCTARSKWRHAMRGVTCKKDAPMAEAVHAFAGKGVDAHPFDLDVHLFAQQGANAWHDFLGLDLFGGVGVPSQLEVDTPHIVWLAVQQHRLIGVEGWIEPKPPLLREIRFEFDVGNEETVAENLPVSFQSQHFAYRRAGAVAGNKPVARNRIWTIRRVDCQNGLNGVLMDFHHAVSPPQFYIRIGFALFVKIAFAIVLLQVDEGWPTVTGFRKQVEFPDFLIAKKYPTDIPGNPLADHALADL